MEFWRTAADKSFIVKWSAVEKRIRQMIAEGSYLTPEELEKYQSEQSKTVLEQETELPNSVVQDITSNSDRDQRPVAETDSAASLEHPIPIPTSAALQTSYTAVQTAHPHDIVLYQMGDFFETFGPLARVAALELDLILNNRNLPDAGRVAMCGIPGHNLDVYVNKLRKKHHVTVSRVGPDGNHHLLPFHQP